jgi:hypothetical protein
MSTFIKTFVGVSIFFALMSVPGFNVIVVSVFGVAMVIGMIRYIKAQM